ncbi:ABC transporter ATP-binding protein [Streptomyces sp. 796.1]|uniref:ABC transporter ATP-binding protein n=1 Tax=Streptomyces sp. 796.1 TaxID=3163029 RepID=UPI0039C8C0D7
MNSPWRDGRGPRLGRQQDRQQDGSRAWRRPLTGAAAAAPATPDRPAIQITALTVATTATDQLLLSEGSLTVRRGQVVALTGPSGAGKTTLLRAACGALPPGTARVGGTVEVLGHPVLQLAERELRELRRRHVAYVGQDPGSGLNPRMRVRSLLRETAAGRDPDAVGRLLAAVRLPADEGLADRRPGSLSGGQQRRVALARALAREPAVLLLDEPTAGLHPALRDEVADLLRELAAEHRLAIALSCHDTDLLTRLADEVVELHPPTPRIASTASPHHTGPSRRGEAVAAPGAAGTGTPISDSRTGEDTRPPSASGIRDADGGRAESQAPSQGTAGAADTTDHPTEDPPQPLLRVRALSAAVGPRRARRGVLHGVGLALPAGAAIGVVGVSGSGKTTLARCVVGLHEPAGGDVHLAGAPLAASVRGRTRDQRRRIQLVPQNPLGALNPSSTAGATLARPLRLHHGMAGAAARARVVELLAQVALDADVAARRPHELSGGQRQRVSIARALAAGPDVLVCDEVTSALDEATAASVMELLGALRDRHGLALVLISHDLRLVADRTDAVLVLDGGRAVESGPTRRVFDAPQHAVTRALLAGHLPATGSTSVA